MATRRRCRPDGLHMALAVSLPAALERCSLGLAQVIDSDQSFAVRMQGALPETAHLPRSGGTRA